MSRSLLPSVLSVGNLAGKGRSGTLACAYLLSRYASPSPSMPKSLRDMDSFSDWSLIGEKEGLQTPSPEMSTALPATIVRPPVRPASVSCGADLSRVSSEPAANVLEKVLDLHTSRRMKPSLRPSRYHPDVSRKRHMGVSIPSQRRWLSYWSQVIAGKGPPSLWPFPEEDHPRNPETLNDKTSWLTKVKLTKLTIRMHEPSITQPHLVQAASMVITSAGKGRAISESTTGRLWACLARYSDRLVDELEHWEKESHELGGAIHSSPFKTDQWDQAKMIRSFAQMGVSDVQPSQYDENVCTITFYFDSVGPQRRRGGRL